MSVPKCADCPDHRYKENHFYRLKPRHFVKEPRKTILRGDAPMEGLVCRPSVPILDKMGNRIIVKIKYCDFKEE